MNELEKIRQQIAELERKAQELVAAERQPVIDDIKAKIKTYNITADELGLTAKPAVTKDKTRKPVPIKYRDPADSSNTWTGRGRKPKWLEAFLLDTTRSIEEFEVK